MHKISFLFADSLFCTFDRIPKEEKTQNERYQLGKREAQPDIVEFSRQGEKIGGGQQNNDLTADGDQQGMKRVADRLTDGAGYNAEPG